MRFRLVAVPVVLLLLSGCLSTSRHNHYRSSLLDYLSPRGEEIQHRPARLQLPLRIGVAFVPGGNGTTLDAASEQRLLDIVRKSFAGREWVGELRTIPSSYLQPRGGFENLEQVASLFDVSVIALISVDQIQFNDPTALSVLYISIVGQYLLPGDRNDTRTLIDVAVMDVASHSLLLRAPGTSRLRGISTAYESQQRLRSKSDEGLRTAMVDLTHNLDSEVGAFKTSVSSGERKDVDIVSRSGVSFSAGGGFGLGFTLLALVLGCIAAREGRR